MKKFRVGVSYSGSIIIEVEAADDIDAEMKAERIVEDMPNDEFIEALDPQHAETNIIEEIRE